MKAPTDKSNDTIQLIVTRRCDLHSCSNCTQLLPFRKDVPSMSPDVFRKALRSLEGWPGIYGVFGGNPCTHPQFADLMQILVEEVPEQRQRGLWSNNLMKHGALVRDVFYPHGRFNMNAHADETAAAAIDKWLPGKLIPESRSNPAWHGGILLDRRDYDIDEATWVDLRENCDINVNWSAAIAEHDGEPYAYFCEVAAALDGVRGVNNGILATPGWWRWKMDRFQGQVANCCDAGCGVPLRTRGHLDRDDTYDISPSWHPLTAEREGKIKLAVHEKMPPSSRELTDYMKRRSKVKTKSSHR